MLLVGRRSPMGVLSAKHLSHLWEGSHVREESCWLLNGANVGENDKVWFPRWLRRYASMVEAVGGQETAHNMFLRLLRANMTAPRFKSIRHFCQPLRFTLRQVVCLGTVRIEIK